MVQHCLVQDGTVRLSLVSRAEVELYFPLLMCGKVYLYSSLASATNHVFQPLHRPRRVAALLLSKRRPPHRVAGSLMLKRSLALLNPRQ